MQPYWHIYIYIYRQRERERKRDNAIFLFIAEIWSNLDLSCIIGCCKTNCWFILVIGYVLIRIGGALRAIRNLFFILMCPRYHACIFLLQMIYVKRSLTKRFCRQGMFLNMEKVKLLVKHQTTHSSTIYCLHSMQVTQSENQSAYRCTVTSSGFLAICTGQSHYRLIFITRNPIHRQTIFILKQASGDLIDIHDDVIKWKHFSPYWPFVRGFHRSPVIFPHKGQWCGALQFSLICVWINGWINNRETGDLRRHGTNYDVTVMIVSTKESPFAHMPN